MTDLRISEAGTVQFPMVKHAVEIGWAAASPDELAKQRRGGDAGMLFREELAGKLAAFNPWMTADAVRSVVETLDAIPATIEGNRDMLSWLRGERQWYDETGEGPPARQGPGRIAKPKRCQARAWATDLPVPFPEPCLSGFLPC